MGTNIRVQFVTVTNDSRCPANVICVWAGDAIVRLRAIEDSSSATYELHTADPTMAKVRHRDAQIELLQLEPYPFSGRLIEPSDYRVTLQVVKASG